MAVRPIAAFQTFHGLSAHPNHRYYGENQTAADDARQAAVQRWVGTPAMEHRWEDELYSHSWPRLDCMASHPFGENTV